jgi:ABC-type transporter Mla subunit MlaD
MSSDVGRGKVMPWHYARMARARLNALEAKVDAQGEALHHAIGVINQINHNVNDLSTRLQDHRIDTETVSALATSFRRYAADLATQLQETLDRLEGQAST